MRKSGLLAGLVVVLAASLPAQVVSHPHSTPVSDNNVHAVAQAATEVKAAEGATKPESPKVTDLQQTQLELYTTQLNMISIQMNQMAAPIQQKRQALIEALVKANPGYRWQEPGGLVKIAVPATEKGIQGPPTPPTPAAKP